MSSGRHSLLKDGILQDDTAHSSVMCIPTQHHLLSSLRYSLLVLVQHAHLSGVFTKHQFPRKKRSTEAPSCSTRRQQWDLNPKFFYARIVLGNRHSPVAHNSVLDRVFSELLFRVPIMLISQPRAPR